MKDTFWIGWSRVLKIFLKRQLYSQRVFKWHKEGTTYFNLEMNFGQCWHNKEVLVRVSKAENRSTWQLSETKLLFVLPDTIKESKIPNQGVPEMFSPQENSWLLSSKNSSRDQRTREGPVWRNSDSNGRYATYLRLTITCYFSGHASPGHRNQRNFLYKCSKAQRSDLLGRALGPTEFAVNWKCYVVHDPCRER